jgi:hypothetical protein
MDTFATSSVAKSTRSIKSSTDLANVTCFNETTFSSDLREFEFDSSMTNSSQFSFNNQLTNLEQNNQYDSTNTSNLKSEISLNNNNNNNIGNYSLFSNYEQYSVDLSNNLVNDQTIRSNMCLTNSDLHNIHDNNQNNLNYNYYWSSNQYETTAHTANAYNQNNYELTNLNLINNSITKIEQQNSSASISNVFATNQNTNEEKYFSSKQIESNVEQLSPKYNSIQPSHELITTESASTTTTISNSVNQNDYSTPLNYYDQQQQQQQLYYQSFHSNHSNEKWNNQNDKVQNYSNYNNSNYFQCANNKNYLNDQINDVPASLVPAVANTFGCLQSSSNASFPTNNDCIILNSSASSSSATCSPTNPTINNINFLTQTASNSSIITPLILNEQQHANESKMTPHLQLDQQIVSSLSIKKQQDALNDNKNKSIRINMSQSQLQLNQQINNLKHERIQMNSLKRKQSDITIGEGKLLFSN